VKRRTLDGPLLPLVRALNRARRAEPALQRVENIRWLETENDALIGYAKDDVVCVVNINPYATEAGACVIPVALGFPPAFDARDLLTGDAFTWRAGRNYVELGPGKAHVIKVNA
jgi:starch synthase (maltosyl-transferring)